MVGGMGVRLSPQSAVQGADWFVALEVEWPQAGTQREALVRVASAISFSWIERWLPNALNVQREVRFDERAQRVVIEERRQVFDLIAEAAMRPAEVGPEAAAVLFAALAHEPEKFLRIDRTARELALRLRYLGRLGIEGFEAFSDLRDTWREVLRIVCSRCTSVREVVQADPGAILWSMLSASLRRVLESEAPSHVTLPNGRSRPLDYETDRPQLALRIQEAFGWVRTPVIGSRNVPVALCLLAPNGRPVQVTTDLASFWQNAYPQIRRELSRRYPRHAWPEEPMTGSSAPPSSVRANRR
jgi:ATP-dependent helicase HrpB